MSQNSMSGSAMVAALKPWPRPARLLLPVVSSLSLWYVLIQGGALGYGQLQAIIEPALAALPEGTVDEPPTMRTAALNRPARPKAETLALTYASRLATIDPAVSGTVGQAAATAGATICTPASTSRRNGLTSWS